MLGGGPALLDDVLVPVGCAHDPGHHRRPVHWLKGKRATAAFATVLTGVLAGVPSGAVTSLAGVLPGVATTLVVATGAALLYRGPGAR